MSGALIAAAAAYAILLAQASPPATGAPATVSQPASECCTIPALTEVHIEILETINSAAAVIGTRFAIRLADPIVIDGRTLVPAGTAGLGEVVHAAKSRFGGKPGELILAVRYLDYNGVRIPLRSLRYIPGLGKDNTDTAAAVAIAAGVVAMFITGGEVNIPAGTRAVAKTATPIQISTPATVSPVSSQGGNTQS